MKFNFFSKALSRLTIACIVVVVSITNCQLFDSFKGTVMPGETETTNFTLIDQNEQPFTLSDQLGKVVLMFFGYTFCPDVCPMTLTTWKHVQDQLKDEAKYVKFVYITVDPERDTPQRLKDHIEIFSKDFIGLTGSDEALQEVFSAYGVYRDRHEISGSATGYLMGHTSRIFVIDQAGNWRLLHNYDTSVEDIVHDIRLLLSD